VIQQFLQQSPGWQIFELALFLAYLLPALFMFLFAACICEIRWLVKPRRKRF
jgi:hypothetical protein